MLLEEMIHAYWRDATQLSAAIPLERFYTGPTPVPAIPSVIMVTEKSEVLFRTNRKSPWTTSMIRFELHHTTFESGVDIVRVIEQSFDRLRLEDPGKNWNVIFRLVRGENLRSAEGGNWKFVRWFRLVG